jgi:hypothetical protein
MIRITIPKNHPVTVIARRRKYLFGRLLMASGQTLVVEFRRTPCAVASDDVIGVVVDTLVDVRHDRLGMLTIQFAARSVSTFDRRVVRLEAIGSQHVDFKTPQTH